MAPLVFESVNNSEKWTEHAAEYAATKFDTFMKPLLSQIMSDANSLKPFSEATTILDMGCGSGKVTATVISAYAQELPSSARFLATDFSQGMIEQVELLKKRELTAQGTSSGSPWSRVETQVLDAQDLSTVPNRSCSHVLSNLCIFALPHPAKAMQEAHRVLAPGGAFAHTGVVGTPAWYTLLESAESVKPGSSLKVDLDSDFLTEARQKALLRETGFVDASVTLVDVSMTLPPDLEAFFARFVRSSNPMQSTLFAGWSEEELDKAVVIIARKAREVYGDGTVTLTNRCLVATGKKPVA